MGYTLPSSVCLNKNLGRGWDLNKKTFTYMIHVMDFLLCDSINCSCRDLIGGPATSKKVFHCVNLGYIIVLWLHQIN